MSKNLDNIVSSKLYVGTLKNQANPKTSRYWIDVVNGVVVLNPEIIAEQLENARNKIQQYRKDNKDILILCEKVAYKDELEKLSEKYGYYYMNYKIPGGVLTNFKTVQSRIRSLNELTDYMESDDFDRLTKKEKLIKRRQLNKLEKVYKGVRSLTKKPDLVIIVDGMQLQKYVDEVEKVGLDNIVLAGSNFNRRWDENNIVMTNVNSFEALDFVLKYILT